MEPTIRGEKYQINNLITQTVEANEHSINYTPEEATVSGQISTQTYSLIKGINNFCDKGLNVALAEVKQLHYITYLIRIDVNKITSQ